MSMRHPSICIVHNSNMIIHTHTHAYIYIYIYIYIYPPPCRSLRRPLRRVRTLGGAGDFQSPISNPSSLPISNLQASVFKFWSLGDLSSEIGVSVIDYRLLRGPLVADLCMDSYPPGRPKIHQKIIKISASNFIEFFADFGSHLASKLDQKSIQNRKKYLLKAASKKQLKNIPFKIENRCFQNRKI